MSKLSKLILWFMANYYFIPAVITCLLIKHSIAEIKWEYSAIVFIENDKVFAEDRSGNIIKEGKAGIDDSEILQAAVDLAAPAGEVKITSGKYILKKTIQIRNNIKITGSGRSTVLVPPVEDFAIKIKKSDHAMIPRPFHSKQGNPLYAMIIQDLTIDGKNEVMDNSGKGISLNNFWSSSFMNLWIQNTGNAITLNKVHESDFRNIYMINNGNDEAQQAGFLINGTDNIHISGLYVIYQNYIGLEINSGAKLVFISQSMFHGWNRIKVPGKFPLIKINDINTDPKNEKRYKADVVIENSRITAGAEGANAVEIINSPVTIKNCSATCGKGNSVISVSKDSRVNVSDNSFYSYLPLPTGKYVLYGEDSELIFKNNAISIQNLQLYLKGMRNSIIADNRFHAVTDQPNIYLGSNNNLDCRSILIIGNIFRKENLDHAIKIDQEFSKNISINDNLLWSE